MDTESQDLARITPLQQMVASCSGALLTSLFVTPLDVVKIRLQAQQKDFMKNKCFVYCNGLMDHVCYCYNGHAKGNICQIHGNHNFKNVHSYHSISVKHLTDQQIKDLWYRRPAYFEGTLDAFVKITKTEGITSLWSGLPPTLVMALPATVLYFTVYDQLRNSLKKKFKNDDESLQFWIPVVAGGTARTFAATLISPLEMIRTKMQSRRFSYSEIGQAVKKMVKNEGFFSLWKGLNATLLRDVPFSCLYWANYENFKRIFEQPNPTFGFSFFAGACSGTVAAVVTLPFDVVKTHRQIELGEIEVMKDNKPPPKKITDVMMNIYKQRGASGLFTGIVPRVVKVAPACAIMISTYEAGKAFFRGYNEAAAFPVVAAAHSDRL